MSSLTEFNRELLTDMLREYNRCLQKAVNQHLLLSNKLTSLKSRFHRANMDGNKAFSYKWSMHIANTSGSICMYEEYMKRKANQISKLETYLKQVERAEKALLARQQSQNSTTSISAASNVLPTPTTISSQGTNSHTAQTTHNTSQTTHSNTRRIRPQDRVVFCPGRPCEELEWCSECIRIAERQKRRLRSDTAAASEQPAAKKTNRKDSTEGAVNPDS